MNSGTFEMKQSGAYVQGCAGSHIEVGHSTSFPPYDQNKTTKNSRNGYREKTVHTEYGDLAIQVPRDRVGEFEPVVIKKHQTNVTGIEDQITALSAKGVSTRDIQDHLQGLYGIEVSPTLVSNVTNKIMTLFKEWQTVRCS